MSTKKAWKRLHQKLSPSTKVKPSPIRPTQRLVGSDCFLNEDLVKAFIWTLLNTEEFHYQNTGSLIHQNKDNSRKIKDILRDHWNVINWKKRLRRFIFLGQGSFGDIYKAIDGITQQEYAIKVIRSPSSNCTMRKLFTFMNSLLSERNIFSELNKSDFFVRLLAAFQSLDRSDFWFVLELCICDLYKLMTFYRHYYDDDLVLKNFRNSLSYVDVTFTMSSQFRVNYEQVIFVYLFEMLCGLHYMASRDIVHADIKPENVLISQNGHLKFSDFGVSFRKDWFSRNSITLLPSTIKGMELADAEDKEVQHVGTESYYDPEMMVENIKKYEKTAFRRLQQDLYRSKYFNRIHDTSQNFLSDLYSVGLIIVEMITGGLMISEQNLLDNSAEFFNIKVIFDDSTRRKHLVTPLLKMSKKKTTLSVFKFILNILTPRSIRTRMFTSKKMILEQKDLVSSFHIDIKKVERILYYKTHSITKENVLNIIFPASFLFFLVQNMRSREETGLQTREQDITCHNLHPFNYG